MSRRVWRAELARVLLGLGDDRRVEAAALLDFTWEPPPPRVLACRSARGATRLPRPEPTNAATPMKEAPDFLLWRAERSEPAVQESVREPPAEASKPAPWTSDASVFDTPAVTPIAPWSRHGSSLQSALRTWMLGAELDLAAIVRAWGRGDFIDPLPRVVRRAWSGRVVVCLDRSRRLAPGWFDQELVCQQLRRQCGAESLEVHVLGEAAQQRSLARSGELLLEIAHDPHVPVLVLGDLGFYSGPDTRAAWRGTARRLRRRGVPVAALVPVPRRRWHKLTAQAWNAIPWEPRAVCSRGGNRDASPSDDAVRALLRLASPAAVVEPGLLRALRGLLPATEADIATEFDAWNHPLVRRAGVSGFSLQPELAIGLREEFAALGLDTQRAVRDLLAHWHKALPEELRHGEALAWYATASRRVRPPSNVGAALRFWRRIERSLRTGPRGDALDVALRRYGRAHVLALPAAMYDEFPWLRRVLRATTAGMEGLRTPPGYTPTLLQREGEPRRASKAWALRQVGDVLRCEAMEGTAWPSASKTAGSPVGVLLAKEVEVVVSRGGEVRGEQVLLREGLAIPLTDGATITLATDQDMVTVIAAPMERWMSATGRDAFGLWAEFVVGAVTHRLRWIPPGRFWMGSPDDEDGRFDDEGPRHEVELTSGYWLGETSVTQALWEAVTGTNPSEFKSANRPVEHVSWYDCIGFMRALEEKVPGMGARLPTEAEWECACRAGMDGPTWFGENGRAALNSIAWWFGNKGHTTQPVRLKSANPHGLYDMLGNVREWCLDGMRTYNAAMVLDPCGPLGGSYRILRGGSWRSFAGGVRAAFRHARSPEICDDALGFRLARGAALRSSPNTHSGPQNSVPGRGSTRRPVGGSSVRDAQEPHNITNPVSSPRPAR